MPEQTSANSAGQQRHRRIAAAVLAGCLGLLLFAKTLDPEPDAHGHQTTLASFGLPGCTFHKTTGLPCATCGMTRSFGYFTDGRVADAFIMQPAGAALALGTAMMALIAAWAVVSGMSLSPLLRAMWRPRHVLIGVGVLLIIWVFNIARTLGA